MKIDKTFYVDFPLRGFLPKQMETIDACLNKTAVLYSGAFRAGKTLLLAHVALMTCLENPGVKGLIGGLTETQMSSVPFSLFIEEAKKYQAAIDKAGIKLTLITKIIHSQSKKRVEFYNGSLVYFRACDYERKLAGYTLDFFGLDEPIDMDETIFTQLVGRISGTGNLKKPFGLLTTNPGAETHWIYKFFYWDDADPSFAHIDTSTYDNILLFGHADYIRRMKAVSDEDWSRRYLNGKWGMFEGAIYKEFNPELHMGKFSELPVKYHIAAVDWGLRDPYVILVGGVTNDDRIVIKEEHYANNLSSHELSKKIAELHKEYDFKKVYCDPAAADLILQTYNRGVPIGKKTSSGIKSFADNDISSGIARVRSLFKNNLLLIDGECYNFKREHLAYRFKQGTDKPVDKDNHTCDACRYLTTDFNPYSDTSMFGVLFHKVRKWE